MKSSLVSGDATSADKEGMVGAIGRGMNYDFCPQFNQYVYWLKKPFGWVICGAIFSGLVGLMIGPQGYVLMWSFLALLIVGAIWPWVGMKGVDCKLTFEDSRTHEGEPTRARLEITNRWPIPMFGLTVEGEFLQDIEIDDDRIAVGLQRIPGWSVCRFEWNFEPRRRGQLPLQPPTLANGFPFGIYRSEKPVEVADRTIVWPRQQDLDGQPELDGEQFNIAGMMSDRTGNEGEVISVRNFRRGDSLRNIHWAKTAAKSELIVKERQKCAQKPIQILLDLSPASHVGRGGQSSYEWAIRIAANIAQQLHQGHAHLELRCLGLPSGQPSQTSNRQGLDPLLDFLALLPQFDGSLAGDSSDPLHGWKTNDHVQTILIATDQSQLVLDDPREQAVTIRLAVDGFRVESGEGPRRKSLATSQDAGAFSVPVTSAVTAADQLAEGWQRGCEHVV